MTNKKLDADELGALLTELPTSSLHETIKECEAKLVKIYSDFLQEHCGYAGADGLARLEQDAFTEAVNEMSDYKPKELAEYESNVEQILRLIRVKLYEATGGTFK